MTNHKLTQDQMDDIRRDRRLRRVIAKQYGINKKAVAEIQGIELRTRRHK